MIQGVVAQEVKNTILIHLTPKKKLHFEQYKVNSIANITLIDQR